MASLPSIALGGTLKLNPALKRHPSAPLATEQQELQSRCITYQRRHISDQVNGRLEPPRHLDFGEMLTSVKDGRKIETSCYVPLLQGCIGKNSISGTQVVHAHIVKTGTQKEFSVMTFLVKAYVKCGALSSAQKVFSNMPRKSVVAWTIVMTGYVRSSQPEVAIRIFEQMLESGSFPSNYTLGIVLNACSSINSIELGKQLHAYAIKYQIDHDLSIGNALCSLYSKFGILESAIKAFHKIGEKDVISWTALICACGENGASTMGLRFFRNMLLRNVEPNEVTLTSVLSLCCTMPYLGLGTQVHSLSTKLGYLSNLRIANSLLYLYLRGGCINEAQNLFKEIQIANLVTWNAMIAGHAQAMDLAEDDLSAHRSGTEALGLYLKLNCSGMRPDLFTMSSVLTVCSKLVALEQGEQIHAQTLKYGYLSDVVVGTALVNMYNKCGSIEQASKAFLEMSARTLISWTSMIMGRSQHGHTQQALQLFEDMRLVGTRPNQITFVGVLAACSHAGMVDEALEYFEMMQKEYNFKPLMDHYRCLIDMFVRMGRLDEAFDIVKGMNFEPSESIWMLLIAGCRTHMNEELMFYAAERLLKVKPQGIETYVMLLNLYISTQRWEDVSRVRKLMKEQKLGKVKDWSWVGIRDKVHSFETNDSLHPQCAEMYEVLEDLLDKSKNHGYKPVAIMEVVDEEVEEKTFSTAAYHSEKLAVAFGLLHTHNHATIRVTKTANMCRDCHDFIKVVSLMSSRKIIIRDGQRLHKFVGGHCSCADFVGIL